MYNYFEMEEDKLEFVVVATEDELGDGERILFEIDGESIVLFKIAEACFSNAAIS